tara:strand:+ start:437 stop:1153 length:717 start_codon:yes stop_codon:yes gene_type:complete
MINQVKQYSKVITYGDSWALGTGLDIEYLHPIHVDLTALPMIPHDEIEKWNEKPYVWNVAQELGCESMIRANEGKSLGVITNTLLRDISEGITHHKHDSMDYILDDTTLLLIMVPPDTRWYTQEGSDKKFTELQIGSEEHKNWIGNKGRYWFQYHQSMFISTIHQVLHHHNIPYLTMNNYGVFECIESLKPLIKWDRHLFEDSDLTDRLERPIDFCSDENHPNKSGHDKIAQWCLEKI